MSLQADFEQAAKDAKNLPNQSNDNLLKMYGLYKQATVGDVSGPKPGAFDFKGKAKYDAWSGLKGKSSDDARGEYIQLVKDLGNG